MSNSIIIVLLLSLIMLAGCNDFEKVSEKKMFSSTSCYIDVVNNVGDLVIAMKSGGVLSLEGWAGDNLSKQAPETVTVNLVSTVGVVTKVGDAKLTVERPDVQAALAAPEMGNAGFKLEAQLEPLAQGNYEIQVLQHFPDRIIACKTVKGIKIE